LGHGFFSVEITGATTGLVFTRRASIGPRIFLRGNVLPSCVDGGRRIVLQLGHGFFSVEMTDDAAAANQCSSLQLGHGFFSVEISDDASATLAGAEGFNWATDFSPWKSWRTPELSTA